MRNAGSRHGRHTATIVAATVCGVIALATLATSASAAQSSDLQPVGNGMQAGTSYYNDVSLPLYYLPARQGDASAPEREGPKNPPIRHPHEDQPDPVIQNQFGTATYAPVSGMPAPIQNFGGIGYPGVACNCAAPDPNGEVGDTQYVQMVNEGLQVFDKATGSSVLGPVGISSIWAGFTGVCETAGQGDPVVLFDQLAHRWLISQFAGTSALTDECIAISTTADATGTWARYAFHLGSVNFDYPHLGMWPDGYYMSVNVFNQSATAFLGPQAFAFDRAAMIAGTTATFITPGITGGASEVPFLPADLDGSMPPPPGAPNPFVEYPSAGGYKMFRYHADFTTPANSTFSVAGTPPAAGFTMLCGGTPKCVPQLGPTATLDGIGDRLMFRLAYRNFGDHESLVGNFTVKANAVAGIRWFEMRDVTSGTPTVYQEGTYQPDTDWRWLGSVAMDFVGNIAIGYSASSATIKPQLRYSGRLAGDLLNTLPQGEVHLYDGAGAQYSSNRWGDYSDLTVDPVDECTFWYTNEYLLADGPFNWATRIGSFKFPNCSLTPGFTFATTPTNVSACAGTPATVTINVGATSGFNSPVTLSSTGYPASVPTFTPNPVPTLPGTSSMQIDTTAAAPAVYPIQVNGTASMAMNQSANFNLTVFNASPGTPAPTAPANAATHQAVRPVFTWMGSNTETYQIDVATDSGFSNIVYTNTVTGTTVTPNVDLQSNTQFYWRVTAVNACGPTGSPVFTFTTLSLPGDCSIGTGPASAYSYGFESGANGWISDGTGNTWALSGALPHAGTQSYFAADPATISDQHLVSPPITLPAGQLPQTLQFWHNRDIQAQSSGTACYDGGILETSTNGGSTWTQVPGASMLTDPYTGAVPSEYGNPLGGLYAWCGAVAYKKSIVDISSFAGQTVQFRFRLGSAGFAIRGGWYVDDVKVQSCRASDTIFSDGFNGP